MNASIPSGFPRWWQSAVAMDGKIWVFGGQDALALVVSSVFCFDIGTCLPQSILANTHTAAATTTWNFVNSSGPPRYGHSAVLTLDSTAMIVFGGGDGEQVHQDTWSFHFGTLLSHNLTTQFLTVEHQEGKYGSRSPQQLLRRDVEVILHALGGILRAEGISLYREVWTYWGRRMMCGCKTWVRQTYSYPVSGG